MWMVVPCPGTLQMLNRPAHCWIRSRIPSSPKDFILAKSVGPSPDHYCARAARVDRPCSDDHGHLGGFRVAGDIGQGFLKDPKDRRRAFLI